MAAIKLLVQVAFALLFLSGIALLAVSAVLLRLVCRVYRMSGRPRELPEARHSEVGRL